MVVALGCDRGGIGGNCGNVLVVFAVGVDDASGGGPVSRTRAFTQREAAGQ